jgi:hypothetical protein
MKFSAADPSAPVVRIQLPSNMQRLYVEKAMVKSRLEYKRRALEYTIYCEQEQQQAKVVEAKLGKQKRGPVLSTCTDDTS